MSNFTVFEISLFKDRSVLRPAQQVPGNERLTKLQNYTKDVPDYTNFLDISTNLFVSETPLKFNHANFKVHQI